MSGYVPTKSDLKIIKKMLSDGIVDPNQEFSLTHFASVVYAKSKADTIDRLKLDIDLSDASTKEEVLNILDAYAKEK